jgi:hypothetical protein
MLKFLGTKTLHKLVPLFSQIHNCLGSERHLVSRGTYKQGRSTAMAE